MRLITDDELAELLGISREDVRRSCSAKGWPCVRPKRSVWRFTEEQVAQISGMDDQGSSGTIACFRPGAKAPRPDGSQLGAVAMAPALAAVTAAARSAP